MLESSFLFLGGEFRRGEERFGEARIRLLAASLGRAGDESSAILSGLCLKLGDFPGDSYLSFT